MKDQVHKKKNRAHLITVGNEKGGCGKSTFSMHLAIYLLGLGQKVGIVDIDLRQQTISRHIQNRQIFKSNSLEDIEIPELFTLSEDTSSDFDLKKKNEMREFGRAISHFENEMDFIIIDTPANDSHLMRLSHGICDQVITPINESFVDLDLIGKIHPKNLNISEVSHYTEIVHHARQKRRAVDGGVIDWLVVLNRRSPSQNRNSKGLYKCLDTLGSQYRFRYCDGLFERNVYREFFPDGLTAIDDVGNSSRHASQASIQAKFEIKSIVDHMRLPINDKGKKQHESVISWKNANPISASETVAQLFGS